MICNPVDQAAKKAAMSAAEKATAAAEQEVNQGFKPAAIDQVRKYHILGDSVTKIVIGRDM